MKGSGFPKHPPSFFRGLAAFKRPLAVVIIIGICIAALAGGTTAAQNNLLVQVFHDLDGDGFISASRDNLNISGSVKLGFSDAAGQSRWVETQHYPGTYNNYKVDAFTPGTWYLKTVELVNMPGYKTTGSYQVDSYSRTYIPMSPIAVTNTRSTVINIPLHLSQSTAAVTGQIVFADGGGLSGARVELLDENRAGFDPVVETNADAQGNFQFQNLSPGVYHYRATPQGSFPYQLDAGDKTSAAFTVLDGRSMQAPAITFTRTAQVELVYNNDGLGTDTVTVAYGEGLARPQAPPAMDTADGSLSLTGWYRDPALANPWDFAAPVTGNMTLHAKWEPQPASNNASGAVTQNPGSISGTVSGGSSDNRASSSPNYPSANLQLDSVSATQASDTEIRLSAKATNTLGYGVDYQWQVLSGETWRNLAEADSAVCTVSGASPGNTYTFRVIATRSDGMSVTSGAVRVTMTSGGIGGGMADIPEEATPLAPAPQEEQADGASQPTQEQLELLLALSTSDPIYTGGWITVTPSEEGGDWEWNGDYLSAAFNSPATFTALYPGTTTIRYTVNGVTAAVEVEILPSQMPHVGQSTLPILIPGLAGLLLLGAAAALAIYNRRGRGHG